MKKTDFLRTATSVIFFALCLSFSAQAGAPGSRARVGKPLPLWKEGFFDIHNINTGRGECLFLIFPDGTSMVIDSGEVPYTKNSRYESAAQKPSDDRRPTETQAAYVRHFLPSVCRDSVDYYLLTHFHNDHMGNLKMGRSVRDTAGNYVLFGTANFYRLQPFRKIVDRDYPQYDTARMKSWSVKELPHYKKFVKYSVENRSLVAEKFEVGVSTQFPMRYKSGKYPGSSVFNWGASGCVWNGEEVVDMYADKVMRENGASCCNLFTYGPFDFYTGGDAGTNTEVEYPIARAIGRKLSAMKATHHFSWYTMDSTVVNIFCPKVILSPSFNSHQPDMPTLLSVLDNPCHPDVFVSNVPAAAVEKFPEIVSRIKGRDGHFVLSVCPGGKWFYVYKVDDTLEGYIVTDIYGPYSSAH